MRTLRQQMIFATLVLSIIGNAACTSIQTINASPGALHEHSVEPGDNVTLYFVDNTKKQITVTEVGESSIKGTDSNGLEVTVKYDALVAIQFEKFDGTETAKNTGKALGVVVAGALILGALATVAFVEGYGY